MAAQTLRKIGRAARAVAIGIVLALAFYALAGWIGSSIPRNPVWQEPEHGVTIMVETNGVHTALVLPLVTPEKDWRSTFPAHHVPASTRPYTHLSISWGEEDVFLNTPTWRDLSPLTVLRVIGAGGEGLLHVAHYVRPAPSEDTRPLTLTREQYRRLVSSIERSLPPAPFNSHPGYGPQDVFYEAPGRYTAANTCNQWTSNMLAGAGVKTGWWTPFAGGVMKWLAVPEDARQRQI